MKRLALAGLLALAACGGGEEKKVVAPRVRGDLAPLLAGAFKEEATGDQGKAIDAYLGALEAAGAAPDDALSVPVAMAALDALVHRNVLAFSDASSGSALAERTAAAKNLDQRLASAMDKAQGPFVGPLVATARLTLAERRGDTNGASQLRARSGCVQNAVIAGPVAWTPISGVREPSAFDSGGPLPATLAGPGPFAPKLTPARVAAFGCRLPLYAQTSASGVRDVVVDVVVPKGGTVGIGMRAESAATLRAGGKLAIDRAYALGSNPVLRFATVDTGPGVLRLVARVGMESDYTSLELAAWDADGHPLRTQAPNAGDKATAQVRRADGLAYLAPTTPDAANARLAVALGALAAHDSRTAETQLFADSTRTDAPPELLLAYGRAVRLARDLPLVKAQERARSAFERVMEAWPNAWEVVIEHAVLAGARRGRAEATIEALNDLDKSRAKNPTNAPALLDAYEAIASGREGLYDRAHAAYERAKKGLGDAPLERDVERWAFERIGKEMVGFACDPAQNDKTSLSCYHSRLAIGDREGAESELVRLRTLMGSPQLFLSLSTHDALERGDMKSAAGFYEKMNPGDRQIGTLFALKGKSAVPEVLANAPIARDAPSAIAGVMTASGEDPLKIYDGIAEKVVADESASALLANAATAILAHDERYDVAPNGVFHYIMLDVRRVMGTTDVESNAQASAPTLYGRDNSRILRRRIFKKDGRVLLPDRTPHAAQSHADLSQLEAGDAVEAIYEGWAVPGEIGNIGIDTPDLFPERTAVREARIEMRLPLGLKQSMWAHPLLGDPTDKVENGKRTLVWQVKDRPIRRLEAGVPKMDRSVCVSFSTTTWDDVARGLREAIAALDADDPEVRAWADGIRADVAKESGKGEAAPPPQALVAAVVKQSGEAVKEASGVVLADIDLGRSGGQTLTARTALATHEGSRTWLIVRALRDLGINADIVVAENDPFSASAGFPPHFGRFMHPLAVVHLPNQADMWIDADVSGPPLPAGRISPELRGRSALFADGRIAPLPAFESAGERDEIDERLVVDDQGNAKGTITVLLRGRAAQDLAEALVRLVGLERQRALRGIALAWVPFATVEKVELSSSEGSWQVAIRAELDAPAYAQLEGGQKGGARSWVLPGIDPVHYVFPRPFVSTLSSTYASHGAREDALAISHAAQYHVRRRIELPAKAKIARLPGPFDGKGPLLVAQRAISVKGSSIEEDFTLDVTTGTVPRDKYDDFVAQAHRTDDAFRASIRVTPP